ncbi:MAG: magnesium transporter [Thermotogaceae bacterium]|jgi:magnesium transporter|nr:magnesium transporter [Thermotogaceae bacterium]
MKRKIRMSQKKGLPPGTLVYTGDETKDFEITVIDYDSNGYREFEVKNVEECFPFRDYPTVTWINVVGLHRVDIVEKIGQHYDLHPLVLEDILNVHQRPKVEYFENYIFVVLKMLTYNEESHYIESEQVSIILGKNFIFTFQERKGDVFEPVRDRIRNNKGIIKKNGADYLLYALIDIIVDNYFVILEKLGDGVEDLEDKVILDPSPEIVQVIHRLKRNLIELRKTIWPLREILNTLHKENSPLMEEKTSIYLRDVYDHTIHIIDTVETLRDMASGLLDVYLSSLSNRMNEIMKVLTIISTIFIPLTFIAGIYGMNFKYMPELEWKFGYPLVLLVMLSIGIGMRIYFKKKKWL